MSSDITPPRAHPSITHETVVTPGRRADCPTSRTWGSANALTGGTARCSAWATTTPCACRAPKPAVRFLQAEMHWVPQLSRDWDFPAPRFVAHGLPGHGYPWPWAVVTWVPGQMADAFPLNADAGVAVGRALAQVHTPAPDDAPFNVEQSIPMADRDAKVRERVAALAAAPGPGGEVMDVDAALDVWAEALAAAEHTEWVWSHADLHGANVLSHDGAFGGIVDWGSMAMCDPAVDLGFTYTLMPRAGVDAAFAEYGRLTGRDRRRLPRPRARHRAQQVRRRRPVPPARHDARWAGAGSSRSAWRLDTRPCARRRRRPESFVRTRGAMTISLVTTPP